MRRIQFELKESKIKELEKMMKELDLATKKDLFNNAITLLQWVIEKKKERQSIVALNKEEDSYIELEMPIFSSLSKFQKI